MLQLCAEAGQACSCLGWASRSSTIGLEATRTFLGLSFAPGHDALAAAPLSAAAAKQRAGSFCGRWMSAFPDCGRDPQCSGARGRARKAGARRGQKWRGWCVGWGAGLAPGAGPTAQQLDMGPRSERAATGVGLGPWGRGGGAPWTLWGGVQRWGPGAATRPPSTSPPAFGRSPPNGPSGVGPTAPTPPNPPPSRPTPSRVGPLTPGPCTHSEGTHYAP